MKEIERRFFITEIPSSRRVLSEVTIFQNYLLDDDLKCSVQHKDNKLQLTKGDQCQIIMVPVEYTSRLFSLLGNGEIQPLSKGIEARIRSMVDTKGKASFFITFKMGKGMVREEIEFPITSADYQHITEMIKTIPLEKVRKYIDFGSYKIEVDLYRHYPSFRVAEVEFPSEAEAMDFSKPSWFDREITDVSYSNRTLWRNIQLGGTVEQIEKRFFDGLSREK
ncbi:hypothetical protein PP175_14630 [Aneurinibacillus sp. Ricciae_BoGa-3]|uniref:hypothetical protein n=1 Tax=Aneurinibacillus sp. Ricciae_BoGa-3 TaxID=3022697 RepID=UPI0023422317|nr:hypothetical protein [Aneurinibacillus sp. Ricciae_BoGa-3]WCK52667.1 hypothetical protein PP175_14630 [Aneurinibacillus sp. Ricciae_BoGa-3]